MLGLVRAPLVRLTSGEVGSPPVWIDGYVAGSVGVLWAQVQSQEQLFQALLQLSLLQFSPPKLSQLPVVCTECLGYI